MRFSEHIKVIKFSYDRNYMCGWQWTNSGLREKITSAILLNFPNFPIVGQ